MCDDDLIVRRKSRPHAVHIAPLGRYRMSLEMMSAWHSSLTPIDPSKYHANGVDDDDCNGNTVRLDKSKF